MATKKEIEAALLLVKKHINDYRVQELEVFGCKKCGVVIIIDEDEDEFLNGMCEKCATKYENEKKSTLNKIINLLTKKVSKVIKFSRETTEDTSTLTYYLGGFKQNVYIRVEFELSEGNIEVEIDLREKGDSLLKNTSKITFCLGNPNVDTEVGDWIIQKIFKAELQIRSLRFVPKRMTYKRFVELGGRDKNLAGLAKLMGEEL